VADWGVYWLSFGTCLSGNLDLPGVGAARTHTWMQFWQVSMEVERSHSFFNPYI
jgi:hypothetical protein